ncbi:MAG: hypothetical protein U9R17_08375 [Thermodesulfobacteriota bacterium]|nr:hypothetical protein [Thermodesulfobacteriota bacterium]
MIVDQYLQRREYFSFFNELYSSQKTGVLVVDNDRCEVKIYLSRGVLLFTEGPDRETALLKKIAAKKRLEQDQLNELIKIRERNPHSLGKLLIEKRFISPNLWDKFLILRAKYHLTAMLKMEKAHVRFEEIKVDISSYNLLNLDFKELLTETIRDMEDNLFIKNFVPGPEACFEQKPINEDVELELLNNTERTLFAAIDGKKTAKDISLYLGLDYPKVCNALCLLLFLELVIPAQDRVKAQDSLNYKEIINVYLDFIKIIEVRFKREIGREFDAVLNQCIKELTDQNVSLFQGIDLCNAPSKEISDEINDRFLTLIRKGASPLALSTSFNKLLYLLIMRMKKILGISITENTINEMLNMINYVKKYRRDPSMMRYIKGNLEDYLAQVKS